MEKYLLDLDEQQRKLLKYCFEQCGRVPTYFEENESIYVGECPDLQIEKIIAVLSEVYFSKQGKNSKLADLINTTIVKLTHINDEITEKIDFCEYFSFDNGDCG